MNDRMAQINELIQQKLGLVLSQKIDVPPEFFITITKIDCSKDLKHAKAFLSVLPFNMSKEAITWVIRNRQEVQKQLCKEIKNLKYTPKLKYFIDESEEKATEVYTLMDNI